MNINISLSKVTLWHLTSHVWFEVLPASLLRTQVFWATYCITVWVVHTISKDHNAFLFMVTKSSLHHWPLPTTPVTQHHFPEGMNPQVKSCSRVSKISHFITKSKMALKPSSPPIHWGVTRFSLEVQKSFYSSPCTICYGLLNMTVCTAACHQMGTHVAPEPLFPLSDYKNTEDGSSRLLCNIAIHVRHYMPPTFTRTSKSLNYLLLSYWQVECSWRIFSSSSSQFGCTFL